MTQAQLSATPLGRGTLWPIVGMLVGGALTVVQPLIGFAVFLVFAVMLTVRSLPLALAMYLFLAPFPLGLVVHGHKLFVTDWLAIVMALVLAARHWQGGIRGLWETFMAPTFRWPLALLLGLSVLSLGVAWSHSGTVVKILEYVEFFVVIVAVARETGPSETAWRWYVYALAAGAALVTLYGFAQFLFGWGPATNQIALVHVRATAFFGQPNVFGAFNEFIFPLLAALVVFGPTDLRHSPWLRAALFWIALGVVISYSRGAWVGDAAAVGLMGLLAWATGRRRRLGQLAAFGVGVPVVAFIVVAILTHVHFGHVRAPHVVFQHRTTLSRVSSLATPTQSYDNQQRLLIWKSALSALRRHPLLGVGLGNFHLFIQRFPPKGLVGGIPPMAHNLYLEWGADLGIGGIVAALWLEWRWLLSGVRAVAARARQAARGDFWYALGLGGLGSVVAFIVHDWVDFMIDHGVLVPVLLSLGLLAMLAGGATHPRRAGGTR